MDINKVLELAKEAEILRQLSMEVPFVIDRLERFAALIEREVRGDAEPVGQLQEGSFGRGQVMWFNKPADETLLYTHPAPALVQQLVEALKAQEELHRVGLLNSKPGQIEQAQKMRQAALAAAKDNGL